MNRSNSATPLVKRLTMSAAVAVALAASLALAPSTPAAAANQPVDPSTLTPPPPDFFNAQCREAGQAIQCDLAFTDPFQPVEEPTGIVCESGGTSFELLDTSIRTVVGKRYYDANGLLLRRHFHDDWVGTWTNSLTGATVRYDQQTMIIHDLATPGDISSGDERATGFVRFYSSHGTVLIDVGRVVTVVSDGTLLSLSGQHPFWDFFGGDPSALQPLCDALAA
jgi:hypothetical protein